MVEVWFGELNAIETLSYMCLSNYIKGFLISVPDPFNENKNIDIYLTPTKKTKFNVSLVDGSPYVNVDCGFTGKIYSITKNSNYLESASLEKVSESCNHYLETTFSDYLYRTSKELKSDINGIGRSALRLFLTTSQYNEYNWREHYQDSFFEVSVDINVQSASLLADS